MKVTYTGFKEFANTLNVSPSIIEKNGRELISQTLSDIRSEAQGKAPVYQGKLKNSIRKYLNRLSGFVQVEAKHGPFMEYGTKPHFPPVAPLERWATVKLGRSGLGFVIARKIAQRGLEARPYFWPAVDNGLSKFEKEIKNFGDRFISHLKK